MDKNKPKYFNFHVNERDNGQDVIFDGGDKDLFETNCQDVFTEYDGFKVIPGKKYRYEEMINEKTGKKSYRIIPLD